MTTVRLDTTVTHVGPDAGAFLDEGIIVLFGEAAPEELRDVSVIHDPSTNEAGVVAGDLVRISGVGATVVLEVLAVGDVANENLANLGHLVLKRNGSTEPAMPGDVCCDEGDIPTIAEGDRITVSRDQEDRDG